MRNPFRKPKHKPPALRLERVEKFTCEHFKNIMDYGTHPKRVYGVCLTCEQFAILAWEDTYGRVGNRIMGLLPAAITLFFIILTVVAIVITYVPLH